MAFRFLAALSLVACTSSAAPKKSHVVVAVTIDWEGAYLADESMGALAEVEQHLPDVPLTHYVSAAYFTKSNADAQVGPRIAGAIRPGDELAVHLHGWASLARAAKVTPKLSPSFISGTEKLLEIEGDDAGFDVDLDVYTVPELRALLRTSRQLLEKTGKPVTSDFRAGGYLGTPKMREAIREEGYAIDSSATEHHQLVGDTGELANRVEEVWPKVAPGTQPFLVDAPDADGPMLEMPIAAVADYASVSRMVQAIEAAHARLAQDPQHDVFVVLAFHQETSPDYGSHIVDVITQVRAKPDIAKDVVFTTVEKAAELARPALSSP